MANFIPKSFINYLLDRCDIVELINQHLPLRKKGSNYTACCPFHEEATPSFTVSPQKQLYHCFGCKAAGNAISFVMQYEKLGFVDAIESMASQLQLEVPREQTSQKVVPLSNNLYEVVGAAVDFYQKQLLENMLALDYLKQRGLSTSTIHHFKLGFSPDQWSRLSQNLMQTKKYSPTHLQAAGLMVRSEKGSYDRFRGRIIFPIRDRRGRYIGLGGRTLSTDQSPKYLNSPETSIFHKSDALYGLYEACQASKSFERIWVVEGYMDVLSLYQSGITQVVATLGTALSRRHLQQLFRLTEEIVFCFDGDAAGEKAAMRALELSLANFQEGWTIRFLLLPQGEDPDSWVHKAGHASFNALLPQALSLSDFLFKTLKADMDLSTPESKAKLVQRALPLFNKLMPGVMRTHLFEQLSHLVNIAPTQLQQWNLKPHHKRVQPQQKNKTYTLQDKATSLLLQYPERLGKVGSAMITPSISEEYPLLARLLAVIEQLPTPNTAILLEYFRDKPQQYDYLATLIDYPDLPPEIDIEEEFRGIMLHFERLIQDKRIEALLQKARQGHLTDKERQQLSQLLNQRSQ